MSAGCVSGIVFTDRTPRNRALQALDARIDRCTRSRTLEHDDRLVAVVERRRLGLLACSHAWWCCLSVPTGGRWKKGC